MIPEVYFILGVLPYAVACLCLYVLALQVLSPLTAFAEVGLPPPAQHQNAGSQVTKPCNVVATIQKQAFGKLMYKTTANRQLLKTEVILVVVKAKM